MYEGLNSAIVKNISDESIALSISPQYPASTTNICVEPSECVRVRNDPSRVLHRHVDGSKYIICFYELLDGTGWIHNFDHLHPRKPTLLKVSGITVEDIIQAASTYGLLEISHSHANRVIHYSCSSARFYIYYLTGTVVVCLPHPRMGEAQFFCHNQTIQDVCDLFANPNTAVAYTIEDSINRFHSPIRKKTATLRRNAPSEIQRESDSSLVSESKFLKLQIAQLDKECELLMEEKQKLVNVLHSLSSLDEAEANRKRRLLGLQQAKKAERASQYIVDAIDPKRNWESRQMAKQRVGRGQLICCHSSNTHFLQHRWTVEVCSIAMGKASILLVYDDGTWTACGTQSMPPLMHTELHLEEYDDNLSPVCLRGPRLVTVALGSCDRCFLRFTDGSCVWHASQEFAQHMQANKSRVTLVAFGQTWESYFILFEDKSYCWSNLPPALVELLDGKTSINIEAVSLGTAGEWFLRLAGGNCHWGNLTKRCVSTMEKHKLKMTTVHFGMDDGAFILRYR